MKTRIIACLLLASLSSSFGCYSPAMISKDELKAGSGSIDLFVVTKDSLEYTFLKNYYRVQGDTLSGSGIRNGKTARDIVIDARLPLEVIAAIETRTFNLTNTLALCAGAGVAGVLVALVFSKGTEPSATIVIANQP